MSAPQQQGTLSLKDQLPVVLDMEEQLLSPPMRMAYRDRHLSLIKTLLANDAERLTSSECPLALLKLAIKENLTNVAEVAMADPRINCLGSALIAAIRAGNTEIAKLLLTDPRVDDLSKSAALLVAAEYGRLEVVRACQPARRPASALELAAGNSHSAVAEEIIAAVPDAEIYPMAINAAKMGHVSSVRALLASQRLVHPKSAIKQMLTVAIDEEQPAMVELLLPEITDEMFLLEMVSKAANKPVLQQLIANPRLVVHGINHRLQANPANYHAVVDVVAEVSTNSEMIADKGIFGAGCWLVNHGASFDGELFDHDRDSSVNLSLRWSARGVGEFSLKMFGPSWALNWWWEEGEELLAVDCTGVTITEKSTGEINTWSEKTRLVLCATKPLDTDCSRDKWTTTQRRERAMRVMFLMAILAANVRGNLSETVQLLSSINK